MTRVRVSLRVRVRARVRVRVRVRVTARPQRISQTPRPCASAHTWMIYIYEC